MRQRSVSCAGSSNSPQGCKSSCRITETAVTPGLGCRCSTVQYWCLHFTHVCDGWIGLGEEKWTHVHIWSNGYILYKQDKGSDICLDAAAFRTKVADGVLLEYVAVDVSRKPGRPPASPAPVRLTDRHFPGSYETTRSTSQTAVCTPFSALNVTAIYYITSCNDWFATSGFSSIFCLGSKFWGTHLHNKLTLLDVLIAFVGKRDCHKLLTTPNFSFCLQHLTATT